MVGPVSPISAPSWPAGTTPGLAALPNAPSSVPDFGWVPSPVSPIQDPRSRGNSLATWPPKDLWSAQNIASSRRPVRWTQPQTLPRPTSPYWQQQPMWPSGATWPYVYFQSPQYQRGTMFHLQYPHYDQPHPSPKAPQATTKPPETKPTTKQATTPRPQLPASKPIDPGGGQNAHMLLEIPPEHQKPQTQQERLEFIVQRMRDQGKQDIPESLEQVEEMIQSWT